MIEMDWDGNVVWSYEAYPNTLEKEVKSHG